MKSLSERKKDDRRERNRIASANCRKRKLDKAKALKTKVEDLQNEINVKKISILCLEKKIEEYLRNLEKNKNYLSIEEKRRLIELIDPSYPLGQLISEELAELGISMTDLEVKAKNVEEISLSENILKASKDESKVVNDKDKENIVLIPAYANQKFLYS